MKMFLAIGLCCVITALFLVGWPFFHKEQPTNAIAIRLNSLVYAFNQARENLGAYPTGSWQQVSAVLSGGNIKNLRFIEGIKTNQVGELLDIWGTPYSYEIGSNLLIKSAGPDCVFGNQDDQAVAYPQ